MRQLIRNTIVLSTCVFGVNIAMAQPDPKPFTTTDLSPLVQRSNFAVGKSFYFMLEHISRGDHQSLFSAVDLVVLQQAAKDNDAFNQRSIRRMHGVYSQACQQVEEQLQSRDNSDKSSDNNSDTVAAKMMLTAFKQMDQLDKKAYEQRYHQIMDELSEHGRDIVNSQLLPKIAAHGGSSGIDWTQLKLADFVKYQPAFQSRCNTLEIAADQLKGELTKKVTNELNKTSEGDVIGIEKTTYSLTNEEDK